MHSAVEAGDADMAYSVIVPTGAVMQTRDAAVDQAGIQIKNLGVADAQNFLQ